MIAAHTVTQRRIMSPRWRSLKTINRWTLNPAMAAAPGGSVA